MLPAPFVWQPSGDSYALWANGQLAALYCPVAGGRWRVQVLVNRLGMRYVFLESEAPAKGYVEAWARKWEARILEQYPAMRRAAGPPAVAALSPN